MTPEDGSVPTLVEPTANVIDVTTDVDALSTLVQTGLINAVVGVFTCVGVFVFLVILSPPLALAAAVILPPLFGATWWYRRRSSVAYARARDSIADVNANNWFGDSKLRVNRMTPPASG